MGTPLVRLRNRGDFLRAAREGKKWVTPGLILQCRIHEEAETSVLAERRLGFTVSRKVGNAVARNRARRRLKAAADEVMPGRVARHRDYVIIGRNATLDRRFPDLVGDLETALEKIGAMADERETELPDRDTNRQAG